MPTEKELEQELVELGRDVERLRIRFLQFFMGIEKKPPLVMREQLERRLRESPLNEVRRAYLKFRFSSLLQKYRTYEVYWDRIMREIEEGRFNRDIFDRNLSMKGRRGTDGVSSREVTPQPKPDQEEPRPQQNDDLEHRLFVAWINARKSLGLPVEGITEAAFRAGLARQRKVQSEKLGVPDVTFEVSIKEGRVVLIARPVGTNR